MKNKRHVWVVEVARIDYDTFELVWEPRQVWFTRDKARRRQAELMLHSRIVKYTPNNNSVFKTEY